MIGGKYNKQEIPTIYNKRLAFIGHLLKEYRWEENLTRQEVHELSGIHYRTVARIERGENVSLNTLFRYLDFLELDLADVVVTDEELV
jgi:transcriptional regulator with XRE-family HTH domain